MVVSTPGGGCVIDINGGGHIDAGAQAGERLRGSKSSIAIRKKVVKKWKKKLTVIKVLPTHHTFGHGDDVG